jgi:predicted permease
MIGSDWFSDLRRDIVHATRSLRAAPVVSMVALLSLVLGIGATTAIFSLVNTLLLRPLPVREPENLVVLSTGAEQARQVFSFATWEQLQRLDGFDGLMAWAPPSRLRLTTGGEPEMIDGLWLSGAAFNTLGISAIAGRTYSAVDDQTGGGADGVVGVASYQFWQRRFAGAPTAVGSKVVIERTPVTIVGILPQEFFGLEVGRSFDVALPVHAQPLIRGAGGITRDQSWLRVLIRLRPGQSIEAATATLRSAQPGIRAAAMPENPLMQPGFLNDDFQLAPAAMGTSALRIRYGRVLVTVLAVTILVLFVACANISNLLLARGLARQHELSIRVALGASRLRLIRQLLVESGLLAVIGGIGGIAVALWAGPLVVARVSTGATRVMLDVPLDIRVLGFATLTTVVAALVFGVVPAVRASRRSPIEAMQEHGRGPSRSAKAGISGTLVIAQVAVSLVLVALAGLCLRTISVLMQVPLGFDKDRVLVVTVDAARAAIAEADRTAFYYRLVDAAAAVPGATVAGGALSTPLGTTFDFPFFVAPSGTTPSFEPADTAQLQGVTPGWLAAHGIRMLAGRDLDRGDTGQSPHVMMVNESFVRRFLAGRTPIGTSLDLSTGSKGALSIGAKTIVGVIGDVTASSTRAPAAPTMYIPVTQWTNPLHPTTPFYISVRTAGSPAGLTRSVTSALRALDSNLVLTTRPLADQVDASLAQDRLVATLSSFFGAFGLLLAALGMYGTTAYAVRRLRPEIAIRTALGALPMEAARLVLIRLLVIVGAGIAIGIGLGVWAGRFIAPLLYGVPPNDTLTLLAASVMLAAIGLLTGWLPARRAAHIAPADILRNV